MRVRYAVAAAVVLCATACGQTTTGGTATGRQAPAPSSPTTSSPVPSSPSTSTPTPLSPTATATHRPRHHEPEHLTQPVALPTCPHKTASPHFATPQAMMRYLAAAWNRNDLDALCHVTNPNARHLLRDMHEEAVHLRLDHCDRQSLGSYVCYLDHDYPAKIRKHGVGHAVFDAAAADRPGWYMTVFESCG